MPPRPATASIRCPANSEPIPTSAMRSVIREGGGRRPLLVGQHGYNPPAAAGGEVDSAGAARVQRVVLADAHALARLEARAALADEDLAARHDLAREDLHAEALGRRVAAVA